MQHPQSANTDYGVIHNGFIHISTAVRSTTVPDVFPDRKSSPQSSSGRGHVAENALSGLNTIRCCSSTPWRSLGSLAFAWQTFDSFFVVTGHCMPGVSCMLPCGCGVIGLPRRKSESLHSYKKTGPSAPLSPLHACCLLPPPIFFLFHVLRFLTPLPSRPVQDAGSQHGAKASSDP